MDLLSTSSKLEPFLLMSKSAKGAAAAKLIENVTAAPGVYVFAELLDVPGIAELAQNEQYASWYKILELFAYHTYGDYKSHKDQLPSLNPVQITKLKHLSIVSLAMQSRILSYSQLLQYLDISSIRELEDTIIDAIYQNVLRGKLDQKEQHFEVEFTMGRDLPSDQIEKLLQSLQLWSQRTSTVLQSLDARIASISASESAARARLQEHERQRDAIVSELQANKGGRAAQDRMGKLRELSNQGDAMDLDPAEPGMGQGGGSEYGKGRKKAPPTPSGTNSRKRGGRSFAKA